MSFTDEDLSGEDYIVDKSPLGLVYIPAHSVEVDEEAAIRYEKHPWLEGFELDGIRPSMTCCIWQSPAEVTADKKGE